jgi:hypothetical protein
MRGALPLNLLPHVFTFFVYYRLLIVILKSRERSGTKHFKNIVPERDNWFSKNMHLSALLIAIAFSDISDKHCLTFIPPPLNF